MKFKIIHVDMNGYNGRENHPERSDEGLVVQPLALEVCHIDDEGHWSQMLDGGIAAYPELAQECDNLEYMWTCVTEDGRTLCLMGHEVEMLQAAAR